MYANLIHLHNWFPDAPIAEHFYLKTWQRNSLRSFITLFSRTFVACRFTHFPRWRKWFSFFLLSGGGDASAAQRPKHLVILCDSMDSAIMSVIACCFTWSDWNWWRCCRSARWHCVTQTLSTRSGWNFRMKCRWSWSAQSTLLAAWISRRSDDSVNFNRIKTSRKIWLAHTRVTWPLGPLLSPLMGSHCAANFTTFVSFVSTTAFSPGIEGVVRAGCASRALRPPAAGRYGTRRTFPGTEFLFSDRKICISVNAGLWLRSNNSLN